jgi:hypothetical protein
MICIWFRAGVERGVIVTTISELDEALEREMLEIRRRGVGNNGPRAVGALNRALGDTPSSQPSGLAGPLAGTPSMHDSAPPARSMSAGAPLMSDEHEQPQSYRMAAGAEALSRTPATNGKGKPRPGDAALSPSMSRRPRRELSAEDDDRRPI